MKAALKDKKLRKTRTESVLNSLIEATQRVASTNTGRRGNLKLRPGVDPELQSADSNDAEMNQFLAKVSKMIAAGAKPDAVRKSIQEILPLLKKRGIKLRPAQKKMLAKLNIK